MPRRRGVDRELEVGALAHYDEPDYYTSTYKKRIDDVQYYVGLAVARGGPVLEYGVGNGRIALPIARHGLEVVGIDHSPEMLADLKARLLGESAEVRARVKVRAGDMRRVKLRRRFPQVFCTFNTALHLYTRRDVEQFLARVREHLEPRGRFVVDLSVPSLHDLTRDPERAYPSPRFRHPRAGVVKYSERFDYDSVRQILFVGMEFDPVDEKTAPFATPLAHRQFFPAEWEALLHYNGFEIESACGDFYGGALDRQSDVMVFTAKLASNARRRR